MKDNKKSPIISQKFNSEEEVKTGFLIVGIGSSAGGLEALNLMLPKLPLNTGMAFIIVQHLDPNHTSMTTEILARKTILPVREVVDGEVVRPNHIYVMPANSNLAIEDGILKLLPRNGAHTGPNLCINFFFQSLAQDQKNNSIGIILSGSASDGTLGLEAIKEQGGLSIVQDPKSAKYNSMPQSAISLGFIDIILPPEQIAEELGRIALHPFMGHHQSKLDQSSHSTNNNEINTLNKIFALLRSRCHVDFTNYKQNTIKRRIARRMMIRKKNTLEDYASYLRENLEETKYLFADLLINVTEFFRDPEAFASLKTEIF